MAAVASITITVDEKGAVTALNNVKGAVESLGPPILNVGATNSKVFQGMSTDHLSAVNSMRLVTEEAGVRLPRALLTLIAQSEIAGAAVKAAFGAFAFIGFVQIAGLVVTRIGDVVEGMTGWREEADLLKETTKALNDIDVQHIATMQALRNEYDLIGLSGAKKVAEEQAQNAQALSDAKKNQSDILAQIDQLTAQKAARQKDLIDTGNAIAAAGGISFAGISANLDRPFADLNKKIADLTAEYEKASAVTEELDQKTLNLGKTYGVTFGDENKKKTDELVKSIGEAAAAMAKIGEAANIESASPLDKLDLEEKKQLDEIQANLQKFPELEGEAQAARTAVVEEFSKKRIALYQDETQKQIDEWNKGLKSFEDITAQMLAADAEQDTKHTALQEKRRDAALQTQVVEQQAAVALLPPWERSYAAIAVAAEEAQRRIDEAFGKGEITADDRARRIAANATEEFAHMRDQLAGDLEGAFNDLTSGKLGARVKKMFEDMVFQMIATWVLGMSGIKQATQGTFGGVSAPSGGAGGIFGGIGGILGIGSPGGSGGVFTPPFLPSGILQGGAQGPGVPISSPFSSDNGAVTSTAAAALGLPIGTAASLPGTISSPTKAGAAAAGGPLGALLSKVFPHGITIGGKTVSGAALAALGVTLGVSGFTSLLSGQGNTAVGALETIGGAALTGFAIGGPVGAVVGGIIGAIGSFFGWLFGSSKIDKQRNALETQLEQQLKVVTDSYDLHHTDYGTAIADAEQLRTQFEGAQDQVKKGANMQQYVGQWVDQAEKHINDFETERVRRSDVISNLPLPEFASGGFTDSYMRGGSMLSILHPNEAILNPRGRAAIGDAAISAANNGQSQPSAPSNVNIHFHEGSIQGGPGANAKDLADEIMRRLRQKFGDRGLNFGGAMG